MLIVGLTGGIAAGKSTVSSTLKEKFNLTIVDADLIARQVVEPKTKAYNAIVATFGDKVEELVNDDLSLNREVLGKAVFGNKENLSKLNNIVHPAVRREILWQLLRAYVSLKPFIILDVPLLFESGLDKICGLTVTVSVDRDIALKRLLKRNPEISPEDANKRINSQMSVEERNYRADLVIDNSGDLDSLTKAVDSIVKEITPNPIISVLDLFPPIAIISAIYTVTLRTVRDRFKQKNPSKL